MCFVNGTYFISANQIEIPNDENRYSNKIRYYQWTPFILLFQALLMYIPRILWLNLNSRYGLNIKNLIDAAKKYESIDCYKNKLRILTYICKIFLRNIDYINYRNNSSLNKNNQDKQSYYINKKHEINLILIKMQKDCESESLVGKSLQNQNKNYESMFLKYTDFNSNFINDNIDNDLKLNQIIPDKVPPSLTRSFCENYLTILYLIVRSTYLLSFIGQYLFLSHLIGNEYYKIGLDLFISFYNQEEWPHLKMFPKITFCEIYIREIGTIHPYLIQCVLGINLLNEIIFLIIWFWLIILISLSGFDLLLLIFNNFVSCSSCKSRSFALKYLELINNSNNKYFTDLLNENKKTYGRNQKFEYTTKMLLKNNKKFDLTKIDKKIIKKDMKKRSNNSIREKKIMNNKLNDRKSEFSGIFHEHKKEQENILRNNQKDYLSIEKELDLFEKFCLNYFNNDTIFALKLIERNANGLIVSEIIEYLWIYYKKINLRSKKYEENENEK